jgi:hypothetical protein
VTGPTSAGGDLATPKPPSLLPRRLRHEPSAPARPVSDLQREREAYRRRQNRRSAVIAAVSTVVVLGGLVLLVTSLPRWPLVQERFFDLDQWTRAGSRPAPGGRPGVWAAPSVPSSAT